MLTVLLAPYEDLGAFSGRIRVSVPRTGVGEASATTLAIVVHELGTNSLKYGALSSPNGTLDVSCALASDRRRASPAGATTPGRGLIKFHLTQFPAWVGFRHTAEE